MVYTSEDIVNIVKASTHPVSARNLARKIGVKRSVITDTLYFASKTGEKGLTVQLLRPMNKKHKKPVWTYVNI